MGKFVIAKRQNGEFQFKLLANNGQIILVSEGYTSKNACEKGIKSVQSISKTDAAYDRKNSANGKYYFNLKAANGQVIGSSEMYASEAGREHGIYSVKINAQSELVEVS